MIHDLGGGSARFDKPPQTAGQNGLNIMGRIFHSFKSKIIHVLLGFGCPILLCDNKHTFGKQMSPDLAMLLAFSIKTVD